MNSRNNTSVDVSVVIVNYKTCELTCECIDSILRHTHLCSAEIIVVDNASQDNSAEVISSKFPSVKVIASDVNGGFAYGNNVGFEYVSGRYVVLLNPDTRLENEILKAGIDYMDQNTAVGVLGPKVFYENGEQQSTLFRFLSLRHLFLNCFFPNQLQRKTNWFGDMRYARHPRSEPLDVDVVAGCFMMVRREVLNQVGNLDDRFFMYGEESEWCYRIGSAGWLIRYNPSISMIHLGAASTSHVPDWKAVEMARGQILFLRFTRGVLTAYCGLVLMIVRDMLRLPYFGLISILNNKKKSVSSYWARFNFLVSSLGNLPKGQSLESDEGS